MIKISKFTDKSAKRLQHFLTSPRRPEGTMNYHQLAGFLFSTAYSPEMVQPSEWLPVVFNNQDPEYETFDETQEILQDILGLYNRINEYVEKKTKLPTGCEFYDDPISNLNVDAPLSFWAQGFAIGHDWLYESWEEYLPESLIDELGSLMLLLSFFGSRKLADAYVKESKNKDVSLEVMASTILGLLPVAAMAYARMGRAIWEALNEHRFSKKRSATSASKVGRNEPCPCGSGKKFKKCCMGKKKA